MRNKDILYIEVNGVHIEYHIHTHISKRRADYADQNNVLLILSIII